MAVSLAERLDALAVAVRAGREVLPTEVLAQVQAVEARAGQRMRLSDQHTVVAFAGSTGSGKSSLVNAVTRTDLAPVGVLRPTTAEPLAVVRGPEGAGPLLDWLGVRRRHHLDRPVSDQGAPPSASPPSSRPEVLDLATDGLVVLDLPDHDSVVAAHRTEAERLVALVDLMVWVVDPQKYADAAVHERYLRGLAGHAAVVVVVLNQVDRLAAEELEACRQDLRRLLEEDGLGSVRLLTTSAKTGEGVADLMALLDEAARRREAAQHRLEADVTAAAGGVLEHCGDARPTTVPAAAELVASLEHAAGVPQVVAAVRGSWLLEGRLATGWPPLRWLARRRADPLRRLHLGRARRAGEQASSRPVEGSDQGRTSLPPTGAAEAARARTAVRDYADAASVGLPEPWALAARHAAEAGDLPDALDRAVAGTEVLSPRRPTWWQGVGALQWLLLTVAVLGGLWLAGLAGLDALRVPVPDPPRWGEVPWPTLAAVGGAVLGLSVAGLSRLGTTVGARRRARRAARRLHAAVAAVAHDRVQSPVAQVLAQVEECREAAQRAAAPGRRASRRPARRGAR